MYFHAILYFFMFTLSFFMNMYFMNKLRVQIRILKLLRLWPGLLSNRNGHARCRICPLPAFWFSYHLKKLTNITWRYGVVCFGFCFAVKSLNMATFINSQKKSPTFVIARPFHLWVVYFIKSDKISELSIFMFSPSPCLNFGCYLLYLIPHFIGVKVPGYSGNDGVNSVFPWTLIFLEILGI